MILNSEFWEALTGAQRRRFAKANCEATYKKAITYQIFATLLGVIGIGLFLPVAHKASKYWKGYYSLREEDMPVAVKIMCGINFVLGLFASIVLAVMNNKADYGMFVNTLSRRRLEAMLNETENIPVANADVSDDPFRIGNFASSTDKVIETRPVRKGCENFPSAAMLAISVVIIILAFVLFSLLFSSCSDKGTPDDNSSKPSSTSSDAPSSSGLSADDFGDLDLLPNSWNENTSMQVKVNDYLSLRKAPNSGAALIAKMPNKAVVTVLNSTDKKDWCFVSYTVNGKTIYGWACSKIGEKVYLVAYDNEVSSELSSVDPSKLLSKAELKEMAAAHIQAIVDVENGFVSYADCGDFENDASTIESKSVMFGTDGDSVKYNLILNASNVGDLTSYLEKYFITSLATSKAKVEVVSTEAANNGTIPESPVVSYNNALYLAYGAGADIEIKMDTFEVLSTSEKAYVITVSGISDGTNIVKFTVNLQYIDKELRVTSYKKS